MKFLTFDTVLAPDFYIVSPTDVTRVINMVSSATNLIRKNIKSNDFP